VKPVRIKPQTVRLGLLGFTAAVNALIMFVPGFNLTKALIGFIWLLVLPGYLATRLLKLKLSGFWEAIGLYVGLSMLWVMVAALLINTLLPLFGDHHPLATAALIPGLDVAWLMLAGGAFRPGQPKFIVRLRRPSITWSAFVVASTGLICLFLTVLGAISLDSGGTGLITWIMLVLAAGLLAGMVARREQLSEATMLGGIYAVALSLLLATSLRGWFITGHDVQSEFHVFSLTLEHLDWNMANFRDAYNACLSITILPTVIHQILGIPALYVYKTLFQGLFALVPVLVYLIARPFTNRLVALLSAIYFMAFPTYFTDMPMLNRQEIAFVFVGLILLAAFRNGWTLKQRRWLICLLGVGMILSHYSTTYVVLVMFGLVVGLRYVLIGAWQLGRWMPGLRRRLSAMRIPHPPAPIGLTVLTVLVAASYAWSVQLTDTGGNVSGVVGQTIASIEHGFASDTKSSDTSYSLIGGAHETDQQQLDQYVDTTVPEVRRTLAPDQLYNDATPQLVPAGSGDLPLTAVGKFLTSWHFPVALFNELLRAGSAAFLQLALLAGVALMLLSRRLRRRLSREYRLFQLTSPVLLVSVVVLPVLSAQYGLLRAFQQALILSGASIVLATIALVPERWRAARTWIAGGLALGFFVSSTGIITTLLGGYPAQLLLSNSGPYYDLYYVHGTEVAAAQWLQSAIGNRSAEIAALAPTDGYVFNQMSQEPNLNLLQVGVYPGVVPVDAYVFLGYTTTVKDQANIYVNGNLVTYRYPMSFLDQHKDLLYANGGASIYR
jgi:uncharacterized membrane protein